jgi:hypothetical protein
VARCWILKCTTEFGAIPDTDAEQNLITLLMACHVTVHSV